MVSMGFSSFFPLFKNQKCLVILGSCCFILEADALVFSFLYHLSHKAYIKISTWLLFTPANSSPLFTICFILLHHLLLLRSSIHLPLVNSAKVTKHIDDLFMLGNPSSPLMTLSLSLPLSHVHTPSVCLFGCLSICKTPCDSDAK